MQSVIAEIHNMTHSEIGTLFDCQSGQVLTLQQALAEKAVVYCLFTTVSVSSVCTVVRKNHY